MNHFCVDQGRVIPITRSWPNADVKIAAENGMCFRQLIDKAVWVASRSGVLYETGIPKGGLVCHTGLRYLLHGLILCGSVSNGRHSVPRHYVTWQVVSRMINDTDRLRTTCTSGLNSLEKVRAGGQKRIAVKFA